jgi:hypothetical protein
MPQQVAVTVQATVAVGREDDLARLLEQMRTEGAAENSVLPFAQLAGVHFARLFVFEASTDLDGAALPASLFYMADVDAPTTDRHLRELAGPFGPGTDAVFGHCEGYPTDPSPGTRMAWLLPRTVAPAAVYVHRIGRTVEQVRAEHRLRDAAETFLDLPGSLPDRLSAVEAHGRVRSFALDRDDLAWARRGPRGVGLVYRVRDAVHLVALPLAALVLLPVLLPAVVVLLLAIRRHERSDVAESGPAPLTHAMDLERTEDHVAQNPFTAVGLVKPGRARHLAMRGVLLGLDYANRHVYRRDNLAGVRTIHFARWVPIDDGRRLIFASSYDGTLESYMDDFIDRLSWGLNAVFSNGMGYPATRWLVLDGAKDETAFKDYLRNHQVVTPVWYSAYDALPARNIDVNSQLRIDLPRTLEEQDADEWMALL